VECAVWRHHVCKYVSSLYCMCVCIYLRWFTPGLCMLAVCVVYESCTRQYVYVCLYCMCVCIYLRLFPCQHFRPTHDIVHDPGMNICE
jgi:hypothetical protein